MRAPIVHKKHCHKDSAFLVNQAGRPLGGPSYNKHVPNIYFILVFGYACYRRCCGLVAAPYR